MIQWRNADRTVTGRCLQPAVSFSVTAVEYGAVAPGAPDPFEPLRRAALAESDAVRLRPPCSSCGPY